MTEEPQSARDVIRECMRMYLENQRVIAFSMLDSASRAEESIEADTSHHDTRSIVTAIHATIQLIEGLLSGSSDTISRCLEGFWAAEKLSAESQDKEWIGNRISRGLSYMFGGLVQLFIGRYVKAGMNLTISYKLIRSFESDVLKYTNQNDSDLIRSLGLLTLALLNFFAMIIPPSMLVVGEYLGVGPSKTKFLEYIELCGTENGIFAYIARLIQVYSVINSKNFMFGKISENELRNCRKLMDQCLFEAPRSLVMRVMNASLCLGEGRRPEAIATLSDSEVRTVITRPEWATMRLAVSYKLGVAYLCDFDFRRASESFREAADAIQKSGRWHYIPFMRALEGMSFMASLEENADLKAAQESALQIFAPTFINRDIGNSVVLPGDYWGARMGYEYTLLLTDDNADSRFREYVDSKGPVIDVLFALITCLYQFDKTDESQLQQIVERATGESPKLKVVLGEYYRRVGKWNRSVAAFDDALMLMDSQVNKGVVDKDSITQFALIFQGAALCEAQEFGTAKEVLADLDEEIGNPRPFSLWRSAPRIPQGNLVKEDGGELDLIVRLRRNALKRLIDEAH